MSGLGIEKLWNGGHVSVRIRNFSVDIGPCTKLRRDGQVE